MTLRQFVKSLNNEQLLALFQQLTTEEEIASLYDAIDEELLELFQQLTTEEEIASLYDAIDEETEKRELDI